MLSFFAPTFLLRRAAINQAVTTSVVLCLSIFMLLAISPLANAGYLEDSLLENSIENLDLKGVEIAIQRGAAINAPLSLPKNPAIKRHPISLTLSQLLQVEQKNVAIVEQILKLLFAKGAKLSGNSDDLYLPIIGGHKRIVSLLLDKGANPHKRIYGYLPTELAIRHGKEDILRMFYLRNSPQVSRDVVAQLRLMKAAEQKDISGMEDALRNGAKINGYDPGGETALVTLLHYGLSKKEDFEALAWLVIDKEADVSMPSVERRFPLSELIRSSYSSDDNTADIVGVFLRRGAQVSSEDLTKRTPLHYAALRSNVEAATVLLQNNAKLSARDYGGMTPLDIATSLGKSREMIKLLRDSGVTER